MAMLLKALLPALLLSLAIPAFAIYKCESHGRISYRDTPCSDGHPLRLDSTSAANPSDSRHRLAREKAEVKRLENARHKREAKEQKKRERAARIYAAKQKKCATLALRKKWAAQDAALAKMKTAAKARRKARRAEEIYQAACG